MLQASHGLQKNAANIWAKKAYCRYSEDSVCMFWPGYRLEPRVFTFLQYKAYSSRNC